MYLRSGHYIKHADSGDIYRVERRIAGGVVANDFCKESGRNMGNDAYYHFISDDNLKKEWEETTWKKSVNVDKVVKTEWKKFFRKLFYQLNQYGYLEDEQDYVDSIENNMSFNESFIVDALFDTGIKNKEELEKSITEHIREIFPEDMANELLFQEGIFYYLVHDMGEAVRNLTSTFEEVYSKEESNDLPNS